MDKDLALLYEKISPTIQQRLRQFKETYQKGDLFIIWELIFCLLTPQSKARTCWKAVERLKDMSILSSPSPKMILSVLEGVRFKYRKSEYVAEAIEKFSPLQEKSLKEMLEEHPSIKEKREFLVKEIKGIGMKEASHFLRNIGLGEDIAILDRHILKNLKGYGVIAKIPSSLGKKRYEEIEEHMRKFSHKIGIPMDHLDLLLWYKETGEVFK